MISSYPNDAMRNDIAVPRILIIEAWPRRLSASLIRINRIFCPGALQ